MMIMSNTLVVNVNVYFMGTFVKNTSTATNKIQETLNPGSAEVAINHIS